MRVELRLDRPLTDTGFLTGSSLRHTQDLDTELSKSTVTRVRPRCPVTTDNFCGPGRTTPYFLGCYTTQQSRLGKILSVQGTRLLTGVSIFVRVGSSGLGTGVVVLTGHLGWSLRVGYLSIHFTYK